MVQARKNLACAFFYGICWASSASVSASGAWTPRASIGCRLLCPGPRAPRDVFQQRARPRSSAAKSNLRPSCCRRIDLGGPPRGAGARRGRIHTDARRRQTRP